MPNPSTAAAIAPKLALIINLPSTSNEVAVSPLRKDQLPLRACLSVRFQGFTPTPQYRPSASSRLWPARPAVLCLPDPCGLGFDSHGGKVFSGKLLEFLTQTGSQHPARP